MKPCLFGRHSFSGMSVDVRFRERLEMARTAGMSAKREFSLTDDPEKRPLMPGHGL
jgi:hypothetical protein